MKFLTLRISAVALLGFASPLHAAVIELNAVMNANGYMTESQFAGGGTSPIFATTDADGADAWHTLDAAVFNTAGSYTTGPRAGSAITVFTNGVNFNWGSLTYDESLVSLTGTQTVPILSANLDVSGSINQNLGSGGVSGLGLVFFDSQTPITFGAIDANDTLTFTNGILTGINLQVDTTFGFNAFGLEAEYAGLFTISGTSLQFSMNDTWTTDLMPGMASTVVWDLPGTVSIPETSSALLGTLGMAALFRRRR